MNRLYLVRHGENPANITKEFSYRRVDYSLTAKGKLQAEQTATFLRGEGIDAIYSSPLKRAIETAEPIAREFGLNVVPMEEFRELNVGTLEDGPPSAASWRSFKQVMDDWMGGNPETSFPGGENLIQLVERVRSGFAKVLSGQQGQRIVITGHGGNFTFALMRLAADFDLTLLKHESQNCSISQVDAELAGSELHARLLNWASVSHLSGEAANLVSPIPERGSPLASQANA